jgi:hypothetical protein
LVPKILAERGWPGWNAGDTKQARNSTIEPGGAKLPSRNEPRRRLLSHRSGRHE